MRRGGLALLLAALGTAHTAAADVSLELGSATVAQPGDVGRACVSLTTGGQDVAGTQNDLVWDGRCATLNDGDCAVAGTHGKQLNTRIQASEDFRLRALILSLTDVDPIGDGLLYCCDFAVEAARGACCDVALVDAGAADSRGNYVPVRGSAARLCVAPVEDPSPTPTRIPPPPAAADDDGCQVAPATAPAAAPWLAALALLLLRRRR